MAGIRLGLLLGHYVDGIVRGSEIKNVVPLERLAWQLITVYHLSPDPSLRVTLFRRAYPLAITLYALWRMLCQAGLE